MTSKLQDITALFDLQGTPAEVKPLGNGLINDTYRVTTAEADAPDYVLQRINDSIFTDVDLLQHNIECVTRHIRRKLAAMGEHNIDRKVLTFIPAKEGPTKGRTYVKVEVPADDDSSSRTQYWRMMVFIDHAKTYEAVTPEHSYHAGKAFGNFESMLADLPEQLGETIPDFHNMELRARQLREMVAQDPVGRVKEPAVQAMLAALDRDNEEMCKTERLYREGVLPKRICHCDTKVNNMMFDENGQVLCVIDLDTVMPSFVFSDYGDFLRTAANNTAEDDSDLTHVGFNEEIFKSFTRGYIEGTRSFLTPVEKDNLPYAVALFPFMQCTRFLWDYISGDHYWKVKYATHNLDRARNQLRLYECVREHDAMMKNFINSI